MSWFFPPLFSVPDLEILWGFVSLFRRKQRKALCKALRMHWNTGIGAIDVAARSLGAGKGLLKVIISHGYFQCNPLCCYSLLFLCYISFINFQTDLLNWQSFPFFFSLFSFFFLMKLLNRAKTTLLHIPLRCNEPKTSVIQIFLPWFSN